MMTFAVFALLPLGLLNWKKGWRFVDAGFLPLLAALAPVVASGISSLVKHKQAGSAQKQQEAAAKQQALADEAAARSQFEASQNSPSALASRQKFTLQLGKLLGSAGGKDKVPPSIYNYLSQGRQAQAYTPGAPYQAPPKKGGGLWDFLGGAGEALSYLDTTKLGKKVPISPGQPTGSPTPYTFQTGQLSSLLKPKPISPFDPGLGRG